MTQEQQPPPFPLLSDELSSVSTLLTWGIHKIEHFEYIPQQMPLTQWPVTLGLSFAYLAMVWILNAWMRNRPAYSLRAVTLAHNVFMTVASLVMFVGMVASLIAIILRSQDPLEIIFCDTEKKEVNKGPLYFWVYIFFLSKFYEWFDTVLIVLKKNKLGFLHVYHHWVTMLLVWMCLECAIPIQWSAQVLNTLVHIFMYYYYSMSTLKIEVWWKKHITQLQITQFILTNLLHMVAFGYHYLGNGNCAGFRDTWGNQLGLLIINSYLILFLHFYAETYKKKRT